MMIIASGAASSALRARSGGAERIELPAPVREATRRRCQYTLDTPASILRIIPRMNGPGNANWQLLKSIARRAMRIAACCRISPPRPWLRRAPIAAPAAAAGPGIRDLRALLWASIDNDDSRDLDQLSVAEPFGSGAVRLLVAIADVDAIVHRGSPIDDHARSNTTSVYTAPQIFPMLPEKLSTDLTSLAEDAGSPRPRHRHDGRPDGAVGASDVYRAQVRNQAKLAYHEVGAWLAGEGRAPAAARRGSGTRSAAAHPGPGRAGAAGGAACRTAH